MLSHTWKRIALSYAALVFLTAGILAFLLNGDFERREEDALRVRLTDQVHAVAYSSAPLLVSNVPVTATNALARELSSLFGAKVTIIKPDGTVVGDSDEDISRMENHTSRAEVKQVIATPGVIASDSRFSTTANMRLLYVAGAIRQPGNGQSILGVARVAYPLTSVEEARGSLARSIAIAVLLVSLPAALLGGLLARSIARPLTALGEVAARFGKGDLETRSRINVEGEIGELSREFNAMAARLRGTIHERTTERNQMAAVLAYMHDGIILTGQQGRIESINDPAARLFATTPEKAFGRSLIEVSHTHELHSALQTAFSTPNKRQRLEINTGGHNISAVVTVVPGPETEGPYGLIVLQDVTELRRLERVRRDFIANIGHELRTPLASVKLLVETLNSALHEDPATAQEFLGRIDLELDRLTQMVRELLELSKIESGQVHLNMTPVGVYDLLERAAGRLRAQAERSTISLSVQAAPHLPDVYADQERIEQVLVNLIHNGIKFTPPGGSVTLNAETIPDGVLISVADTGAGIPSDDLSRVFERFYKVDKARTGSPDREGGTGLGLAIARNILQAHDGQIWVESELGEGTTVFFTLPTTDQ